MDKQISLGLRVTSLILVVTLGSGILLSNWVHNLMHEALTEEIGVRTKAVAGVLTEVSTKDVIERNIISAAKSIRRNIQNNPDITYLYVTDFDGNIFVHSFDGGFPTALLAVNSEAKNMRQPDFRSFETPGGQIRHISYPLIEGAAARLHIGIDMTANFNRIEGVQGRMQLAMLTIAFLAVLAGLLFSLGITRPLRELAAVVTAYGEGKDIPQDFFEEKRGGTEIVALRKSFGQMLAGREWAEESLRESEARLNAFFTEAPAGLVMFDGDLRYAKINRNLAQIHATTPEDHVGKTVHEVMPNFAPRLVPELQQILKTGEAVIDLETEGETPANPGAISHFLSSLFPIFGDDGKPRGIGGVTVDVTPRKRAEEEVRKLNEDLERRVEERTAELRREVAERKRAEEELRESEERFRIIFEETMTATTFGKPPGRMHMVNRAMCEMFGYSEQELLNISILDIIHPDYRHLTRSREERSLASSGRPYQIEKRYVRKDGESVWAHLNVTPICDAEGKTTHFIRQYHDITERKRAEEALRDLSRRNELILETAGDGIYGVDLGGKATFVNPAAAGMVGWAAEDLVGRPLHELLHHTKPDGNRYPPTECPIYAAFKDGQVHHVTDEVFWRKDGASFPVEYTSTPIYEDDEITGAVVVFRDVTEKRRMQAQLIQSSKLATLGEMATGVAHELNQPLNVVRLAAHNILRKVGKGKADAKYLTGKLETITAQTERAASIIDHMRIFGRPASAAPAPLDPRKMVESTLGLIGKQLERSGIAVGTELPDTCSLVLGHQVQVEQVLLNLVVNARDAVEAHRAEGKREIEIRVVEMAEDSTVEIVVRDNGGGIEPKVLDRIFEPFFTTKEVGQGTGLGLSISYGIVNEMGGRIAAANTEDGTEFTITLPIAAPKAKTA